MVVVFSFVALIVVAARSSLSCVHCVASLLLGPTNESSTMARTLSSVRKCVARLPVIAASPS